MDIAVTIVMMIPVILAVALIVNVVRKNITERQPGDPVDITGAIPAVIVLMVAVLIIGSMGASISYDYDEDSGQLTVNASVGTGEQKWDSYGSDVKSLVLGNGVQTVADGAFDTLTGLEYISISDSVESITSSAFGVTLKDYLDQTITDPVTGEYVGAGDGTLYFCDSSIFTYNTTGGAITGLTSDAASAVNIVLPRVNSSTAVTAVSSSAFASNTTIELVESLPDSNITLIGTSAFSGCTSLASANLPDSLVTLNGNVFKNSGLTSVVLPSTVTTSAGADFEGCTSLASAELSPLLTGISNRMFFGCTSLASLEMPSAVTSIGTAAFSGCTSLASLEMPSAVTSIGGSAFSGCTSLTTFSFSENIATLGTWAFSGCSGVTSVTFAEGFAPTSYDSTAFRSWAFYDSDGTTTISASDAANLAGFTFQGTASALVKVLPDRSVLTAAQTFQVQELTKAASLTLKLAETEISSVEEKELASA